jgi:purine-binding chemotaxis protein CheW
VSATKESSAVEGATGIGGKFLTFFLAEEEYGVEILKVHEIIGLLPITRVPRTPSFIRGVVNLRGRVIPIVDLRLKFGMEGKEATEETCIVVVQVQGVQTGLIVDRVNEVLDIADGDVEDAPNFGTDVHTEYLLGIAKTGGRVRLLLDIDRVLSENEVIHLHGAGAAAAEGAAG